MKTHPQDQIFPVQVNEAEHTVLTPFKGLTKREYFAALAMQGICATITIERDTVQKFVAESSVRYADALITALNAEVGE